MKLTNKQKELLNIVAANNGSNTKQIREKTGDYQAYESYLRDRLFRLFPLVTCEEKVGKHNQVVNRKWFITEEGKAAINQ